MRDSGREALIGYLLGALDESERREVEEQLVNDAGLRSDLAKLGRALKPLDAARTSHDPPAGLAARTLAFIDGHLVRPAAAEESAERGRMSARPEPFERRGRFRWQDVLAACALTLSGVLLLVPAIDSSRSHARLLTCQDNLRHLGGGLGEYSQLNAGLFPPIPSSGNMAVAGAYAPQLLNAGLIDGPQRIVCPSSSLAEEGQLKSIPTLAQIKQTKDGKRLLILHRLMGGSYGYHLGHVEGGELQPTKNQNRTHFAMMSDAPNPDSPRHATLNHDGKGQNVLYEDGHVQFIRTSQLHRLEEDFFSNDDGRVEAGKHENDAVVAPSQTPPLKIKIHFRAAAKPENPSTQPADAQAAGEPAVEPKE